MSRIYDLNRAIAHMEENLYRDITAQDISRAGFVSLIQLYRDFYAYTGHSVKEYVRKRRLSNALAMVRFSDEALAHIALCHGFSSQQAFCRSVRLATGLTPLEYRNGDCHYYFPPFRGSSKPYVSVAQECIPGLMVCKFYHAQLMVIEARAVEQLLSALPGYEGRVFGCNGQQSGNRFCYELWIEESPAQREALVRCGFVDFEDRLAQTGTYATLTVGNEEAAIGAAWDYLYGDWLQMSMFEQADGSYFEEYMLRRGRAVKLRLYLPIRRKESFLEMRVMMREERTFLASRHTGADAEERASRAVVDFLTGQHPDILRGAREFYVSKDRDGCTCGIGIPGDPAVALGEDLVRMTVNAGRYAVLSGPCCADAGAHEARLASWMADCGLSGDGTPVFALYETGSDAQRENITMRLCCRLKDGKNG